MVKKLFHALAVGLIVICLAGLQHKTAYAAWDEGMGYNFGESAAERSRAYSSRGSVFKTVFITYLAEYKDACWFCDLFAGKTNTTYTNKTGITEDEAQSLYDPYQNPGLSVDEMRKHNEETTAANWDKKTTYSGGIYDAINVMTKNLFNEMATDFLTLLGIGILFFILLKVGKMLVQFQEVDEGRLQCHSHRTGEIRRSVHTGFRHGTGSQMEFHGKRIPGRTAFHVLYNGGHKDLRGYGAQGQILCRHGLRHPCSRGPDRHPPDGAAFHHGRLAVFRRQGTRHEHRETGVLPAALVPGRHICHSHRTEQGKEISQQRDSPYSEHRSLFLDGGVGDNGWILISPRRIRDGFHSF